MAGPLTTQTIQEEARAAPTEERALQVRGTDFYLPLGGQPRISERKSWRAPIVTEQGNPGIYVQIDEWMPLYKGNVYVVDEVTGRMYLSKGEHLMRIAETASHHPFQDHELSIPRHIPEREHPDPRDLLGQGREDPDQQGEVRGNVDPLTPIPGLTGEIGRTPVPVAESTHQPGEEAFTPREIPGREGLEQRSMPRESVQDQGELARRAQDTPAGEGPDWVLPEPSEPHRPPRGGDVWKDVPFQGNEEWGGNLLRQGSSSPEQRIVEVDKRCQKRLAALARDHIIKLREERERMAYGWLGEYAEQAFSAKQGGISLGPLRAEYIHRYNTMLDRERQPHSDFFTNLSPGVEEELDFSEEDPFDLSVYDQSFEWDEVEYMKLQFIAARHYASQGHWDDAYAYILRTRPDNIPQYEDIYNRNAQAWHYTNARIN